MEKIKDIYNKDWKKLRIASFDTETTGLDIRADNIVEFGVVIYENEKPVESYCKLIKPKKNMGNKASKVCGITDEMLVNKKTFDKRIKKIKKLLYSCDLWCAFNDQFDRGFLEHEFKRYGHELIHKPTIDPLTWGRSLWPSGNNSLDDVSQKLRIKINKRELRNLGISVSRHRADYDAYISGLCLFSLSNVMPKTLRQTLYVQDYIYRKWLLLVKQMDKKYQRYIQHTMPPEHS